MKSHDNYLSAKMGKNFMLCYDINCNFMAFFSIKMHE